MFQQVHTKDERHYALGDHVINTERDLDLFECIAVCLSHQSCHSINYDVITRLCEMNNVTRHDVSPSDWIERQGNVHYEIMKIISNEVNYV
jgi:hypothetical protein